MYGYGAGGCPPGLAKKNAMCMPPGPVQEAAMQRRPALSDATTAICGPTTRSRYDLRNQYGFNQNSRYYYGDGYLYQVDPAHHADPAGRQRDHALGARPQSRKGRGSDAAALFFAPRRHASGAPEIRSVASGRVHPSQEQQDHHAAATWQAEDGKRLKTFKIYRYDPDSRRQPALRHATPSTSTRPGRWSSTR